MENELPKIDLPEDVLVDVLTDSVILNLYAHFPCRIKAEILVLCKKGDIDASINLVDYHVSDNSFLVVLPGSIFQVNQIRGDVEIYFAGFSSDFLRTINPVKSLLDITYSIKHNPVVPLKEEIVVLLPHLCHQLAVQQPQDGYGQPLAGRTDQPGFRTAGARQLYQREECGVLCQ